jgi:hypothetical protein
MNTLGWIRASEYLQHLQVSDKIDSAVLNAVMPNLVGLGLAGQGVEEIWRAAVYLFARYLENNAKLKSYFERGHGRNSAHKNVIKSARPLASQLRRYYVDGENVRPTNGEVNQITVAIEGIPETDIFGHELADMF